ncbi:MAG: SAP domain-containing protein [Acidimicrobiia bacterium]|nr:SAP domain-containing protein [Acidimicrobiia bacterium]
MQYVARRRLRLNGIQYEAQQVIPDDQLPGVAKLGSLQRVGYIVTVPGAGGVPAAPQSPPTPPDVAEAPTPVDVEPAEVTPSLQDLKVPQLRKLLKERGLPTSGDKKTLIGRLSA